MILVELILKEVREMLTRIESKLDLVLKQQGANMSALDDQIAALQAAATANTNATAAAEQVLSAIPGYIATAVSQALSAGATTAQLAALTALQTTLTNNASGLAASVTANTPAAPPAPPAS